MANPEHNIEESINLKFFLTMFEPVRFELVKHLADGKERSIKEIAENFTQDRSVISRHLEQLQTQGIVIKEKRSRHTFYTLDCELITQHIEKTATSLRDLMNIHTKN